MSCETPLICNNMTRTDRKCPDCQGAIRRATKRHNNYKAHGPCQTPRGRAHSREVAAARKAAK